MMITLGDFSPLVEGTLSGPENSGESKDFPVKFDKGYFYAFRITFRVVKYVSCRVSSFVFGDKITGINSKDSIVTPERDSVHHLVVYSTDSCVGKITVSSVADRYAPSVVSFLIEFCRFPVTGFVIVHDEDKIHPNNPLFDYFEFPNGGELNIFYNSPYGGSASSLTVYFAYWSSSANTWVTSWKKENVRVESGRSVSLTIPNGVRGYLGVHSVNWNSDAGVINITVIRNPPAPEPQPQPKPQPEPYPQPQPVELPNIWEIIKEYMSKIIHDELPVSIDPIITKMLITINVLIFGLFCVQTSGNFIIRDDALMAFGLIPIAFLTGEWFRILTSMYLHADFLMHLGVNMTFLFVFGDNVEEITTWKYVLYYHLFGIIAGLGYVAQALAQPELMVIPAVGASGAISGIIGYYIVRFPDSKVVFLGRVIPSYVFGGLFFLEQISLIFMSTNVAWSAHLAGLLAGVALATVDKRYG